MREMACGNGRILPVLGIFAVINITSHGIVLLVIHKCPKFHSKAYLILVSLSFSDLLMGVILFPASLTSKLLENAGKSCDFVQSVSEFFLYASVFCTILNIALLNLDRYRACMNGLKYTDEISTLLLRELAACWLIAMLLSGLSLLEAPTKRDTPTIVRERLSTDVCHVILATVGLVLIVVTQLILYRSSSACIQRIIKERTRLYGLQAEKLALVKRQRKTAFVVLAITLAFAICYLPMAVMKLLRFAHVAGKTASVMESVFAPLIPLSGALNPWVYGLSSSSLRKALHQKVRSAFPNLTTWWKSFTCNDKPPRSYSPHVGHFVTNHHAH